MPTVELGLGYAENDNKLKALGSPVKEKKEKENRFLKKKARMFHYTVFYF